MEDDLKIQVLIFQQALQAYLEQYADNINHEEATEFDLLVMDAQKSCLPL
jgi:hypothetical protein